MVYPPNPQIPQERVYVPYPAQPSIAPRPYMPPAVLCNQGSPEEKRSLGKTACGLCWMLVVVVALMVSIPSAANLFLQSVGFRWLGNNEYGGYTPLLYYLVNGVTYILAFAIPPLFYLKIKHISLTEALPFQKTKFGTSLACIALGMGVCMLANYPANWVADLLDRLGVNGTLPDSPLNGEPSIQILYFISLAVIPPIVEELVFRGAILHGLRRFGDGFAILGSAFLFGMFHGNFIQIPFAFLCGLVLAFVVVKTGNLWVSIVIHFINNGMAAAVTLLERQMGDGMANALYMLAFYVWIVLGIIAVIFLAVRRQRFFSLERSASTLRSSQKLGKLVGNAGAIVLLVYCILSCFLMLYL